MDTALLLPSTAPRTPTKVSVVRFTTTGLLRHVHLTVVGRSGPRARKAVDEPVSTSSLDRVRRLITSSMSYLRCHDLAFQLLVVRLGLRMRFRLLFEGFLKLMVFVLEILLFGLHGYRTVSIGAFGGRGYREPCILSCNALICEFASCTS